MFRNINKFTGTNTYTSIQNPVKEYRTGLTHLSLVSERTLAGVAVPVVLTDAAVLTGVAHAVIVHTYVCKQKKPKIM